MTKGSASSGSQPSKTHLTDRKHTRARRIPTAHSLLRGQLSQREVYLPSSRPTASELNTRYRASCAQRSADKRRARSRHRRPRSAGKHSDLVVHRGRCISISVAAADSLRSWWSRPGGTLVWNQPLLGGEQKEKDFTFGQRGQDFEA